MNLLRLINERIIELREAERVFDREAMRLCSAPAQAEEFGIASGRAQEVRLQIKWLEQAALAVKRESLLSR